MENYLNDQEMEKVRQILENKIDPELWSKLELILCGGSASGETARDRSEAEADTKELLSANDQMACDSAAMIYGKALGMMGVAHTGIRDRSALQTIYRAERSKRRRTGQPLLAMDAAGEKSFLERYPGAAKIGVNSPGGAW